MTRNESADAIDRVLSRISNSRDFNFLLRMYDLTCDTLRRMPDTERIMFNVQMKLCRLYVEKQEWDKAQEVRAAADEQRGENERESFFFLRPIVTPLTPLPYCLFPTRLLCVGVEHSSIELPERRRGRQAQQGR